MAGFPRDFPRKGEVYWAPLDKVRPAVVVTSDEGNKFANSVVVAAITRTIREKRPRTNIYLPENQPLPHAGEVLCRNLYTLLKDDLAEYEFRADLSGEQMAEVNLALAIALGLPRPPRG